MEGYKCYCFFDNGFTSNVTEPNKRDIKFIWDGFILFTELNITLEDIRNGVNLYNSRLVALQRTNTLGKKFNGNDVRNYIITKLKEKSIPFEIMKDEKQTFGYPSQSDLWSTRDFSVLLDAIDCVGNGNAYYFKNSNFRYEITFNNSMIAPFLYSHNGAIVLHGESSTAISRLIFNNKELKNFLEEIIGEEKLYSRIENKYLPSNIISNIKSDIKKY